MPTTPRTSRTSRPRVVLSAVAIVLAAAGIALLVTAVRAQRSAPQPPPSEAGSYALNQPTTGRTSSSNTTESSGKASRKPAAGSAGPGARTGSAVSQTRGPLLPRSRPTHLRVPAIGVNQNLITLGLNPDRTVQVPPLSRNSSPGWYKFSPTPGQLGPSIILGHIDSAAYGPAVFFRLGDLRRGDRIYVTRADQTVAVFRVDAVAEYPKNRFPTLTVYGNTDNAALRLITCGGTFNFSTHNYQDNIVTFASLISSHRT